MLAHTYLVRVLYGPGVTLSEQRRCLKYTFKEKSMSYPIRISSSIHNIMVFMDTGTDIDDMAALVYLAHYHKIQEVNICSIIVNLKVTSKRAALTMGALVSMGLDDIPVGVGTDGTDRDIPDNMYEFEAGFPVYQVPYQVGSILAMQTLQTAQDCGCYVRILCTSPLRDCSILAKELDLHPTLWNTISSVHIQGGVENINGQPVPDPAATNNSFDMTSAQNWYKSLYAHRIYTYVYTKHAAHALSITSSDLRKLYESSYHPVAKYLYDTHIKTNTKHYQDACNDDPTKRFRPFMDSEWFLTNKSSWYDFHDRSEPYPSVDEIGPYLTKVVMYDVIAAVGCVDDATIGMSNCIKYTGVLPMVWVCGVTSAACGIDSAGLRLLILECMKRCLE